MQLSDKSEPPISGQIWLCPHRWLTHDEARKYLQTVAPLPDPDIAVHISPCPRWACRAWITHQVIHVPAAPNECATQPDLTLPKRGDFTLCTFFRLCKIEIGNADAHVVASQRLTRKRVKHALSNLKIPACSHVSLSDRLVRDHFHPDCLLLRNLNRRYRPCICSTAPWPSASRHCRRCPKFRDQDSFTWFAFQAQESESVGRKYLELSLTLHRHLGSLLDCPAEAGWTCHALDVHQLSPLPLVAQEWMFAMGRQGRADRLAGHPETFWSAYNQFRHDLRSAWFRRKALASAEGRELLDDDDGDGAYRVRTSHLTPDRVLEQKAPPGKHESGEGLPKLSRPEDEAPPPYTETV